MTNESGDNAPTGRPAPLPVLNDRPAEAPEEAEERAEAIRQETGGAIDADAAHDRSS